MKRKQFEYRTIELMHGSLLHEQKLAELTDEGWELVAVVPLGQVHIGYVKRLADEAAAIKAFVTANRDEYSA